MNGLLYLYKNDFSLFFRRNVLKFISSFALALLFVVLAIRNAVCIDELEDFFEGSGRITLGYVRGDRSLFIFTSISFFLTAAIVAIIPLCAYNDFTLVFSSVSVALVAYRDFFDAVVILRYYSIKAVPLFILYIAVTLIFLTVLILYTVHVGCSQYRYRYGIKELGNLFFSGVPFYVVFSCLYVVRITFVCIGCLFL